MSGWRQKTNDEVARVARYIVRRPWWVIAACMLFVVGLASQLPSIRFDTSTEGFLHDDDPALIAYNAFRDQFGRDDLIILALQPARIFDLEFLSTLRELHERLESDLPHLDEVTSLINARATRGSEDELLVEDLLEEWPAGPDALPPLEDWVLGNPTYRNLLISEDGRFTTIAIRTAAYSSEGAGADDDFAAGFDDDVKSGEGEAAASYLGDDEIGEVVAGVRAIVAEFRAPDFPIAMAGSPVAMDVVKRNMRHDMLLFVRLTILAIAVLLALVFRRASAVFLPLVVVVFSLVSTIGLMAACGAAIKLPTMVLPSFLLAVGVGDSVHILALFFRFRSRQTRGDRIRTGTLRASGDFDECDDGRWSVVVCTDRPGADLRPGEIRARGCHDRVVAFAAAVAGTACGGTGPVARGGGEPGRRAPGLGRRRHRRGGRLRNAEALAGDRRVAAGALRGGRRCGSHQLLP